MNQNMNYLIVMPLYRENPKEYYQMPLGILYVSSAMKQAGLNVSTLNLNHYENPYEILKEKIQEDDIDVILSGGLSPQYENISAVFEHARNKKNDIISICGGGLITADPIIAMQALEIVVYGVIGEGEVTAVELCKVVESCGNLQNVKGIVYKENNLFQITEKRDSLAINSIPWPDYEGFEYDHYLTLSNALLTGISDIERAGLLVTSRSCVYNCTFCFHSSGTKYRQRHLDDVFDEIDCLVNKYQIKFLYIIDELFTKSIDRLEEFCNRIKKYNISWNCTLHAKGLKSEILPMLKEANCVLAGVGMESADNRVLKSMKKNVTIEEIESAIEMFNNSGIMFGGTLIFGDICETAETARNTINWWKRNSKVNISMIMIKVYPGTYLYKYALENNIITDAVDFHKQNCPPVNVSSMTDNELANISLEIGLLQLENTALESIQLLGHNSEMNTYSMKGTCPHCGEINMWDSAMFFYRIFYHCQKCKASLNLPIPFQLIDIINNNIKKITALSKVLLWGLNDKSLDYLVRSNLENTSGSVFATDISSVKQKMSLPNIEVVAPSALNSKGIETVVVLLPQYITEIKTHVETNFKNKRVISIYDLLDPDFVFEFSN
jgi:anaerobic magnesium-protoporphyrin IX monomethyl ester cyclase